MHAMSDVEFLLTRQNSLIETCNKTDIRKARYWFANEVMNMANEQNKNTDIRLMEGRVQTISRDEILEVING